MPQRRPKECRKKRMRLEWLRFELRMKLAAEVPRVIRNLADLHVYAVRCLPGQSHAMTRKLGLELAVELVPVPVPLADVRRSVSLFGEASRRQPARIRTQPHGAAELIHAFQLAQLIYDAIGSRRIEFRGIRALQSAHVPCK